MKNRNLKPGALVNHLARLNGSFSWVGLLIAFVASPLSAKAADSSDTAYGAFALSALTSDRSLRSGKRDATQ